MDPQTINFLHRVAQLEEWLTCVQIAGHMAEIMVLHTLGRTNDEIADEVEVLCDQGR